MEELKKKNNLSYNLVFQQDNASFHNSKNSLEAIEVLFGENKIWWPANSPDLSPIETVWAIIKQELSKRKCTSLNELRNNIIDIWSKFPNELCEKIVAEFDEKILICKKEEGNIINKKMLRKYRGSENKKIKIDYNWDIIKRDKSFRIVYNDKIILALKNKLIRKIKGILNEKTKEYKKDNPKAAKTRKLIFGVNYKTINKRIKDDLKETVNHYEMIINHIKNINPNDFIENFLNQNLINDKKYLINTQFSKKIEINFPFLIKLFKNFKKENNKDQSIDEEINNIIETAEKRAKFNRINKYLPKKIEIDFFPGQKKYINKDDKEIKDEISEETQCTYKDSINMLKNLDLNIKEFRKKNKSVIEKEKKIKINQINENDIENDGDDEMSEIESDGSDENEKSEDDNESNEIFDDEEAENNEISE